MNDLSAVRDGVRQLGRDVEQLGIRMTSVEARLDQVDTRLDKVDQRLDKVDQRLDKVDQRLDKVDQRLDKMDQKMDGMAIELIKTNSRIDRLDVSLRDEMRENTNRIMGAIDVVLKRGEAYDQKALTHGALLHDHEALLRDHSRRLTSLESQ